MTTLTELVALKSTHTEATWRICGRDVGLLSLRLWFGGAMLFAHGIPKIERLNTEPIQFADPFGLGPFISLLLTLFSEVLCAALVLLGLATRLFAIPLIITMITAAFIIHGDDGFKRQELALTYLAGYIVILLAGPGRFAIDRLLVKKYGATPTSLSADQPRF